MRPVKLPARILALCACVTAGLCHRARSEAQPHEAGVDMTDFQLVFDSDVRILSLGDSFASWTGGYQRIFPAILLSWPIESWSGVVASADPTRVFCVKTHYHVGGGAQNLPREVGNSNSYEVEMQSPGQTYFGLPINTMQEMYMSPSVTLGAGGEFFETTIPNASFSAGMNGRFTQAGDELRYRLVYYTPTSLDAQYGPVILQDDINAAGRISVDLRAQSRPLWHLGQVPGGAGIEATAGQINAPALDLPVRLNMDGIPRIRVIDGGNAASPAGDGKYLTPAGHVLYHVDSSTGLRRKGLYYTNLADASWFYFSFGANRASVGDKRFTRKNLVHWLDVTTLDRDQPLRVFYLLDVQGSPPKAAEQQMRSMIEQTRLAAAEVGIPDFRQCIVIPQFHLISGTGTQAHAHTKFQEQRDIAFKLAREFTDVSAASIYDATGRIMLNGSQEARDWLAANGFETFTYGQITADLAGPNGLNGNLLDNRQAHPRNNDAAAFFAHILGEIIRKARACPADCDPSTGAGVLDIFDFLCFQDAYLAGDPAACDCDTTTGPGACDIFDFLCFQSAFARGCL